MSAVVLALVAGTGFGDDRNAGSALEMIKIPGGDFTMGTKDMGRTIAYPAHKVTVATFELDKDLVTTAAYKACVDAKACEVPSMGKRSGEESIKFCNYEHADKKGKHPINCVDFADAKAFCTWAGKRLPTEEEYEYAARGAEGRTFPWGAEKATETTRACWLRKTEDHTKGTCGVGSFTDGNTPLGVEDLNGNLFEWTSSTWRGDYTDRDHKQDLNGSTGYAVRGGSWKSEAMPDTLSRHWELEDRRLTDLGFRCAR